MIISEKIMSLRKKMGWSQEDLANELNVSRQSVSKWETGASIPDMNKVIQMSDLFGVTTDYLLRDNFDDDLNQQAGIEHLVKTESIKKDYQSEDRYYVTMEESDAYLEMEKKNGLEIGFGVALCIWSSILVVILMSISESNPSVVSEKVAESAGVTVLFIMIALAVYIFITRGGRSKKYDYIEKEIIQLEYGVEASVKRKKESFDPVGTSQIAVGIGIILLGVIPTVVASSLSSNEVYIGISAGLMLFFIGLGVMLIIRASVIKSSFKKLLEEEDYRRTEKLVKKEIGWLSPVYFSVVTALYLGYSFITNRWDHSWIIWPVAGTLYSAIYAYMTRKVKDRMDIK